MLLKENVNKINELQEISAVRKRSLSKNVEYNKDLFFKTDFLINSDHRWANDLKKRFDLVELNKSFRESVPVLEFIDWKIIKVEPGYVESILPINPNSSNQHITHQAALMLLSADYTGGLALSTLFHDVPVVGFWALKDDYGAYMWGAKSNIKWHRPSFNDLICKARIDKKNWPQLAQRFHDHKIVVTTVRIEMFNGDELVAESNFTYWAQDTIGIMKNAFDENKINILYEYKTKATARLIAGLRSLEQEKEKKLRMFEDPYAHTLAGKHGVTLARRFCKIIPQIQNMVSSRTKNLDQIAVDFTSKYKKYNVINIGSGYDTRFWRLDIGNQEGMVYDLDLPVVLNDRKKIFDYNRKKNFKTVPIDLLEHDLFQVMVDKKCFNINYPTLIIWEGGSMYFKEEKIKKILFSISKVLAHNNDSIFWFDYVSNSIIENKTDIKEIEDFTRNMSKMGEAFVYGFQDIEKELIELNIECFNKIDSDSYLAKKGLVYKHYRFCLAGTPRER